MAAQSDLLKKKRRKIVLSLHFPDATEVYLGGDFNDWNYKNHPMKRNKQGLWEKILLLYPGKYEYKFMVDGQWKLDPGNDWKCENCYGTLNNIIKVSHTKQEG